MVEPQLQISDPTWHALAACAEQLNDEDFRALTGSALEDLLAGVRSGTAGAAAPPMSAREGGHCNDGNQAGYCNDGNQAAVLANAREAIAVLSVEAARMDLSGAALREALLWDHRGNSPENTALPDNFRGRHDAGGRPSPRIPPSHAVALSEQYDKRKIAIREGRLTGYSLHTPWPRLAGASWRLDFRAKSSDSVCAGPGPSSPSPSQGAPGSLGGPSHAFAMKPPSGPEPIFHIRLLTRAAGRAQGCELHETSAGAEPGGVPCADHPCEDGALSFVCTEEALRDLVAALRDACKAPERHVASAAK